MTQSGLAARTITFAALLAIVAVIVGLAFLLAKPGATATPSPVPVLTSGVRGTVTAGPTCPAENQDGLCATRQVAGATIVARNGTGAEVGRTISGADGTYILSLIPGTYTIEPQPVEGLMGTAQPATVTVLNGEFVWLDFVYDTGIR
jgi:hypothetical protein